METIQTVPGRLLYLAHNMYVDNLINSKEKGIFKGTDYFMVDLIFGESQSIYSVYESYLQTGTLLTLKNNLITLIRKQKDNDNWDSSSSNSKKSSKKGKSIKIAIPPRNIQKLPAQMNRI